MDKTVGVLGGGQLGRMLAEAANRVNIQVNFLDAPGAPAKQITNHDGHENGSFKDSEAIQKLASKCDVITVEIEHVDTHILEQISAKTDVQPSWKTIRTIQDKYLQKEHLQEHDVATAQSIPLAEASVEELSKAAKTLGLPLMLKSRKEAYDGKGNFPVKSESDFDAALKALGGNKELYAEKWAEFRMELAVMVVKTKDGVLSYPTVETVHENSICKLTYAPARGVSKEINEKAQALARKAVECFWGKGVFGVEMFLLQDDTLLINEIAPRPHNSGHYTIEACPLSQYDAHLHAILDLPISQKRLRIREPSIMLNILGGETPDSHIKAVQKSLELFDGEGVHLYGKGAARKGRKMGHITITAPTMVEAEETIQPLIDFMDKDNSDAKPTTLSKEQPLVAVVMGSDSDMPVLQPGLAILEKFHIPYTTRITSAHRTPNHMTEYASTAADKGIKVIIAAAGGAAHLPGMAAAHTSLPVIGIPVKPTIGDGMDSVLSILNMPKGVPVATVSVNNSINAALLAARFLGIGDLTIRARTEHYMRNSEAEVMEKDRKLVEMGHEAYAKAYLQKK